MSTEPSKQLRRGCEQPCQGKLQRACAPCCQRETACNLHLEIACRSELQKLLTGLSVEAYWSPGKLRCRVKALFGRGVSSAALQRPTLVKKPREGSSTLRWLYFHTSQLFLAKSQSPLTWRERTRCSATSRQLSDMPSTSLIGQGRPPVQFT